MKHLTFLILCFYLTVTTFAQPPRRDTTGGSIRDPWRDRIVDADVLEGQSTMTHIVPRQRLCFDKVIKIKQVTSRGPAESCLFINTTTGLIAHSPVKRGAVGVCDIKPETEDFSLFVMALTGNTYHYFNQEKKNTIEHHIVTMNSQQYTYTFAGGAGNATLKKKTERRSYCEDKAKAWAYRVDGRPEIWYLYGKQFPDEVLMTPKKFLGNYGVGYIFSDKGLFLIMQLESPAIDTKILEIRDENVCFVPTGFKVFEEEFVAKAQSSIQRKREKLDRELASVGSEPCASLKRESLQFEREALERREQNVNRSQQGHTGQDPRTQQALGNAVLNYDDALQQMIHETKYKICRQEQQIARQSGSQSSSVQRAQQRLTCMQNSLSQQISMQSQFAAVDRQYAGQPGKIHAEKSKLLIRVVAACD